MQMISSHHPHSIKSIVGFIVFVFIIYTCNSSNNIVEAATLRSFTNNTSEGDWFSSTSWTPNGIPTFSDDVVVALNGSLVMALYKSAQASSLTVGSNSGVTVDCIFQSEFTFLQPSIVYPNATLRFMNSTFATVAGPSITVKGSLVSYNVDLQPDITVSNGGIFGIYNKKNNIHNLKVDLGGLAFLADSKATIQHLDNSGGFVTFHNGGNIYPSLVFAANGQNTTIRNGSATVFRDSYVDIYHPLIMTSGSIVTSTSTYLTTQGIVFLMTSSHLFIDGADTLVTFNETDIQMSGYSIIEFYYVNHIQSIDNTNIIINDTSNIVLKQTILTSDTANITIHDNGFIGLVDNANFYVTEGKLHIHDWGQIVINKSQLSFAEGLHQEFIGFGNSRIYVNSGSSFYLNGSYVCYDNATVYSISSEIYIYGSLNLYNHSTLEAYGGSFVSINGHVVLEDSSKSIVYSTNMMIQGTVEFKDNSTLDIWNSQYIVPGSLFIESNLYVLLANLSVLGDLSMTGQTYISTSQVVVLEGKLSSSGVASYDFSTIAVLGSADFSGKFTGIQNKIYVQGGNILVKEGEFNCSFCVIAVQAGQFLYTPQSTVNLVNTSLLIFSDGTVYSQGDVNVYPGSKIYNEGHFSIESNILPTNLTAQQQAQQFEFQNYGTVNANTNSSQVNLTLVNSGHINLNYSTIQINTIKVVDQGLLNMQGGQLSIDNPIQMNSGSLVGSGTVNGHINNTAGIIGTNDGLNTQQLNVIGNVTHHTNSTLRFTINTLNDFSQLNMSKAEFNNGSLEIQINKQLFNQKLENVSLPVMNYQSSTNAEFKSIKITTYDPDTKEKKEMTDGKCVQTRSDTSKLEVLLSDGCGDDSQSSKKKVPVGVIVGVVIAAAVLCAIGFSIYHYNSRIQLYLKHRRKSMSISLSKVKQRFQ